MGHQTLYQAEARLKRNDKRGGNGMIISVRYVFLATSMKIEFPKIQS